MARPKKNLTDLNQVHGKLPEKPFGGARNLDEIIGYQVSSNYKQRSVEEYRDFLATLDVADLRQEAGRIGMIPSPDARTLKRNLEERFIEAAAPHTPMRVNKIGDKNALPADLRKLMGND